MIRTRSKAQKEKSNGLRNSGTDLLPEARDFLDIPGFSGKMSCIIKTYSKKQPRRLTSSRERFLVPHLPDLSSKHDISAKEKVLMHSHHDLSNSNFENLSTGKRKRISAAKVTKRSAGKILGKNLHKKMRNKTTVSVGSMSTCTMLHSFGKDADIIDQSMSLCSISNGTVEKCHCGVKRRNSTMANCDNVDTNFVPDDISIIEGDENQRTIASYYNEQTPIKQPHQASISQKKVKFSISKTCQISRTDQHGTPMAKRSILKTPSKNAHNDMEDTDVKCPKTSTPTDPDKKPSLLQCDLSLLDNDCPIKANPIVEDMCGIDTEKLLEFEPLPLECSENLPDCERDFTPETHNPSKTFGSGKERRRLSYNPGESVPPCILLDLPVCEKKKATVLFEKHPMWLTIKHIKLTPTDVLL